MSDPIKTSLNGNAWPVLPPLAEWEDTFTSLHMWTQIVGKIRMAQTPLVNHWWNVPLYVTACGLTTSAMPHGANHFQIDFDFIDHVLRISTSRGKEHSLPLRSMSCATFYKQVMQALRDLDVETHVWPVPVEVETATPFEEDTEHNTYEPEAAQRFWRVLLQVDRVFQAFSARYLGKVSPVHFFWGAFDLAVTRFSGREAPPHPGGIPNVGDFVMREAYSHEVSSAGFWPGAGLGEAAFYAYAYPGPEGFTDWDVAPEAAYFHKDLGEFLLPYEAVRTAANPDKMLLAFLQSTYEAAADLAGWDRDALERDASAI